MKGKKYGNCKESFKYFSVDLNTTSKCEFTLKFYSKYWQYFYFLDIEHFNIKKFHRTFKIFNYMIIISAFGHDRATRVLF